jgi:cytochrome c-type biogenesis protein CcmF
VIFLGYALWTVPFALAVAALLGGRVDSQWVGQSRPWALMAWTVLGGGILLGAYWAYEELSWGGYWGWDPVENGSLLPWLTGTALIHALMAWQHRRVLKKTALALAIVTFGLCNFATFLTRSGIFSSLHAFSQSPIGWLFLALMILLAVGGLVLLVRRRGELSAESPWAACSAARRSSYSPRWSC